MNIIERITDLRNQIYDWKKEGKKIGFVPTMGYLHEGHLSLIQQAVKENDYVVVSVFVNPTQFGAGEDLESYPRDLARDAELCEKAGVDVIFTPLPEEMYPNGYSTYVNVEGLTEELCGITRPGHFRGVCTVVSKLFHIVEPDRAYFGRKDAQQLCVIRRMVEDMNMPIQIVGCPIIRESDGLAKSSRNTYLNPQERQAATVLSRAICAGEKSFLDGNRNADEVIAEMCSMIQSEPLARIDYVKIVDLATMKPIQMLDRPFLAAIAVYIGKTRLIDNFMQEVISE